MARDRIESLPTQAVGEAPGCEAPGPNTPRARARGVDVTSISRVPSAVPVDTGTAAAWCTFRDGESDGESGEDGGETGSIALGATLEERFEILGKIGEGGMGRIIIGHDRALRRTVAIKELRGELVSRRDAVARFRSEAQIVAQLEHPGIVPIYAAEQHREGPPAFSMKYVRGRDLAAYLNECVRRCKRRENPSREHSRAARLEIFVKICEALAYAHSRGVIHRDLKPENVMIGAFGEVYVMDWGIAKLLSRDQDDQDDQPSDAPVDAPSADPPGTQFGAVMGTLTHMPPEQAKGDVEQLTPAADQYALGMILYELVTLSPPRPFDGDSQALLARAVEGAREPVVHRYGRRLPPGLVAIIEAATQRDPARRYPSVSELAEDVGHFMRGEEVSVRPDNLAQRAGRFMSTYPTLVLGAIMALVLTAGFVVVESLLETLEMQETSQLRAQQRAARGNYVAATAADIDTASMRTRMLVEGLATEVGGRLGVGDDVERVDFPQDAIDAAGLRGGASHGPWLFAPDFDRKAPPQSAYASARYGRAISFEHGSYWLASNADLEAAARDLSILVDVDDRMRKMSIRTVDPTKSTAREALQNELLRQETAGFQFIYVGLASGLLLNYPGVGGFDAAYDPRQRPWYTEAVARNTTAATFGSPYRDVAGTGLLLPCNAKLVDEGGGTVGVVGGDVRLVGVRDALDMSSAHARMSDPTTRDALRGFEHAAIVDAAGGIILDTDVTEDHAEGTNANRTLERPPYPDPRIRAAIELQSHGLTVETTEHLLVMNKLNSLGWYLVVRVDRDAYDGRKPE